MPSKPEELFVFKPQGKKLLIRAVDFNESKEGLHIPGGEIHGDPLMGVQIKIGEILATGPECELGYYEGQYVLIGQMVGLSWGTRAEKYALVEENLVHATVTHANKEAKQLN